MLVSILMVHGILGIRASPKQAAGGRTPRVAWTTVMVADIDEERVKARGVFPVSQPDLVLLQTACSNGMTTSIG